MTRKTLDARSLKCPECGAGAEIKAGEPIYRCRFCDTSFAIEAPWHPPPAAAPPPPREVAPKPARAPVMLPSDAPGNGARIGVGLAVGILGVVIVAGAAIAIGTKRGFSFGGWSGKEPLVCSGNEQVVVDHVTAHFSKGVAIDASGNCTVVCKECKLEAPTVVRAKENASVHLDHGSADGATFYEVEGNASVSTDHTKATGAKRDATTTSLASATWPSSGPFVCGNGPGGEFKDVKIKVTTGAAIVASVNCSVKLTRCTIEAPTALLLNDNADVELDDCDVHVTDGAIARANGTVTLEGGTFIAKNRAADLRDNASLRAHGTKIEGSESTEGNAKVERE